MNPDEPLPDLYKLPPMDFQEFDTWKKDSSDDPTYISEPEPDYSDSDGENNNNYKDEVDDEDINDFDPVYTSEVWQTRREKIDRMAKEKYEQMFASAERNVETVEIPEPDYLDAEDSGDSQGGESPRPGSPSYSSSIITMSSGDTNGTEVEPKKLPNPCLDSRVRQELHRELLLNQKLGKDVLHQKSELMKELERRRDNVKKRELEEYYRNKRTSLEVKLEEQASKLKVLDQDQEDKTMKKPIVEEREAPEFLKVFSKINRAKVDS